LDLGLKLKLFAIQVKNSVILFNYFYLIVEMLHSNIKKNFSHSPKRGEFQVRFCENVSIRLFVESEESKNYRCKYWEYFAIDRERFKNRIKDFETYSAKIFDEKHRNEIYQARFKDK